MQITRYQLQIDSELYEFINSQLLTRTSLNSDKFWLSFSDIVTKLMPKNIALLATRTKMQTQIDDWHCHHQDFNFNEYKQFLIDIKYIEPVPDDFKISTQNVAAEIASIAGPQLVVPVSNARFAINAVNARWGSLYDAIYSTDVVGSAKQTHQQKLIQVFKFSNKFLDDALPLATGKYQDVVGFKLGADLSIQLANGSSTTLKDKNKFIGFNAKSDLIAILFSNNNLHIELQLDRDDKIGSQHPAGIKNILLESAITTILDMEDSVATVNAADKINCYQNLLGLMLGTLSADVTKSGITFTRALNPAKQFSRVNGENISLSGLSVMLIRNVGHHMFTDTILTLGNQKIPEGILDAMVTGLIALINNRTQNHSCYVVKPKMHGSDEVAFTVELFTQVELALNLPKNTIKIGIMDEERRTTVNLKACIKAAKERIVFINTGFLDRTGDEIHTSMYAGPMMTKNDIKQQKWLDSYEENNVKVGLDCGFSGIAQIGKGMWAIPDQMQNMLDSKIAHLQAGANCSWVPSPTAATLHATHYHKINVFEQQLNKNLPPNFDDILQIPLLTQTLTSQQIQQELDNNIQGILGYVVHWINSGVGCSKVSDINNVGLMEDRATLRISSQHVANWLQHSICDKEQIIKTLNQMTETVNQQNQNQADYLKITADSPAYLATKDLILDGINQDNGYTEFILTKYRRQVIAES